MIGLDGLEPGIVDAMLSRAELPNLARVQKAGSYRRLKTTYPAQTPVAWSSFATGTNPGGHGILDFISRDPENCLPDAALSRFERPKSMFAPPRVVNQRQGVPFWISLTQAGVPSTVLRCPCTFPPDSLQGNMLAGVGVPDLRGSQSKGTFYTQDRSVHAEESEQVVYLDAGDSLSSKVIGPRNTAKGPAVDAVCDIRVRVDRSARKLVIETGGTPPKIDVAEGQWSDWVRFKFKLSMLQSVSGIARFHVRRLDPHVEFYLSAVNFDPAAPLFPICSPPDYAKSVSEKIGLFSTLGMAEDHNGLNNGRFDEKAYLDHCELVLRERELLLRYELDRFKEGFFFMLFDTPDRLQHMMWRFRDSAHPLHERDADRDFTTRIEQHYQRCDSLLGPVLDKVDENTLLIVLSDHGFNTFRRAFDTNTWLHQNGLLALKDGKKPGEDLGEAFAAVDWSRTSAYALGLGGIYLNLKGREKGGIVEQGSEADRVRQAIRSGLAGHLDSANGSVAIRSVSRSEELYSGAYANRAPDLLVNFQPGYRVAWKTAVGGFANHLIEDNTRKWSGDHIVDPEAVPGMLFVNRPGSRENPSIIDLAPTILKHLGVAVPNTMEGKPLLSAQ